MWLETEERLEIYRFLAGIFNTIPTEKFTVKFIKGLKTWGNFGSSITKKVPKLRQSITLISNYLNNNGKNNLLNITTDLGIDRTRLVGGISKEYGPPPPYESVYRDGEIIMGPSTKMVWQEYQKSNIYHAWKLAENPPDYLGLELEYMYFLCQAQLITVTENEKNKIKNYQKHFLKEHLGKWVPAYCIEIRGWAKTDFYKGVGLFLDTMIAGELKKTN